MQFRDAVRWAAYYRVLASVAFLLGAGIAGAGLYVGSNVFAAGSPSVTVTGALTNASFTVVVPAVLVGIVVWQVGSTAAYYRTMTGAVESELGGQFDSERVKSEILSKLDERLSEMHADIEATRQAAGGSSDFGSGGSTATSEFGTTEETAAVGSTGGGETETFDGDDDAGTAEDDPLGPGDDGPDPFASE